MTYIVMLWAKAESYNKKEREMENLMFLQYTGYHTKVKSVLRLELPSTGAR